MNIAERVASSGVIGAGGAGFPTNAKLASAAAAGVEVVIANGAECEPLLHKDQSVMALRARQVIRGLLAAKEAVGAQRALVATKAKYGRAVASLRQAIDQADPGVQLVTLEDFYPAGDEVVLIAEATGRIVPPGKLPMAAGATVFNVESLANVAAALAGEPVTHKQVTVAGAVGNPGTFAAPVGARFADLLATAGGLSPDGFRTGGTRATDELVVLVGGPMMGQVVRGVAALEQVVSKKTAGFIVIPPGHLRARSAGTALVHQLTRATSACCGCSQCTDLCPRALMGHPLQPHQIMLSAGMIWSTLDRLKEPQLAEKLRRAFLCSECGVCETWACPMGLSPRQVNAHLKRVLRTVGITSAGASEGKTPPRPVPAGRRVPAKRLLSRLGLPEAPFEAEPTHQCQVSEVRVPLAAHAGPTAVPLVSPGEEVACGQVIGRATGKDGLLWTQVHASLTGVVTAVTQTEVVIKSRCP